MITWIFVVVSATPIEHKSIFLYLDEPYIIPRNKPVSGHWKKFFGNRTNIRRYAHRNLLFYRREVLFYLCPKKTDVLVAKIS